jgi:hypothetical protein
MRLQTKNRNTVAQLAMHIANHCIQLTCIIRNGGVSRGKKQAWYNLGVDMCEKSQTIVVEEKSKSPTAAKSDSHVHWCMDTSNKQVNGQVPFRWKEVMILNKNTSQVQTYIKVHG